MGKFSQSIVCLILVLLLFTGCSGTQTNQNSLVKANSSEDNKEQLEQLSNGHYTTYSRTEIISSPQEAKQLLIDGNKRFVTGKILSKDFSANKRKELLQGQHPFAVVVSCSDSRVPPEEIFDQALGDLFVIRVAGNVITPIELGSVEYAVEHLKSPLIVVLGHEKCGAVTAAVQGGEMPGSIGSITKIIEPAVNKAKTAGAFGNDLIERSIDLNVANTIAALTMSSIIKHSIDQKQAALYGAKYHLDSGTVVWLQSNNSRLIEE